MHGDYLRLQLYSSPYILNEKTTSIQYQYRATVLVIDN